MNSEEQFVSAAVRRIYLWMGAFALTLTFVLLLWKGPWYGGGFAAGAALSVLNFHWLNAAVDALASHFQRAATEGYESAPRQPGRTLLVAKFVLRYALMIAVGYVIFRTSVLSLTAFLGGLFVFVAGVLAEMVYELATGI